jgi:hypothetical protein
MERIFRLSKIGAILLISGIYTSSYSQERKIELNAQAILARVDRVLAYPSGEIRGRVKHVKPNGSTYSLDVTAYVAKNDYLFIFSSRERGDQLKVLYNLGGEDIWVYNTHAVKLYHKRGIDKYDPVMFSNFSFTDLSHADLQSNYTASIQGTAIIKGYDAYKLRLKPIFRAGGYGMLTLYVTRDELIPLRIDFHDRDNVIFKFLTISKIMRKEKKMIPVRYDMMNIRNGSISILSFYSFDNNVRFDRSIFRSEKLGE